MLGPRQNQAIFTAFLFLAACGAALGQQPGGQPRRPNATPPAIPPNVVVEKDVQYGQAGDQPLLLDIVRPKEPGGQSLPVVAFIHGGGWSGGSKESAIGGLIPLAASGNYWCVSVEYRLSGTSTWPAQIHDCKAAIRWIRANAEKYLGLFVGLWWIA